MNRFHVHLHVADLDANIAFYSRLFGADPSVRKSDYAKWLLEDPRLNFALSTAREDHPVGLGHLGVQVESDEDLARIGDRLAAADAVALAESGAVCCYARSDKFWAVDPQGLRWESFRTFGESTSYFAPEQGEAVERERCCGPQPIETSAPKSGCGTSCGTTPERQVIAAGTQACCA